MIREQKSKQYFLEINRSNKSWLKCAFHGNYFVIGMETYKIHFNPSIKTSIYTSPVIQGYINNVKQMLDLIEKTKPFIRN